MKWVSQNCNFKIDLNLPSYRSFQIYWISSAFEIFFRTHHNFRKQQLWCSFLWSGNTFVSCETLSQLGDICFCGYFSWLDNLYLLRVNFDPMGASAAPACSPRQWCPIEREATLIYLIIFKWHNLKLDDDLCYCDHCNCQTNGGLVIKTRAKRALFQHTFHDFYLSQNSNNFHAKNEQNKTNSPKKITYDFFSFDFGGIRVQLQQKLKYFSRIFENWFFMFYWCKKSGDFLQMMTSLQKQFLELHLTFLHSCRVCQRHVLLLLLKRGHRASERSWQKRRCFSQYAHTWQFACFSAFFLCIINQPPSFLCLSKSWKFHFVKKRKVRITRAKRAFLPQISNM